MKIKGIRLVGIRCFDDTGDLHFEDKFNLIVGQNNAGKSTLLRSILHFQGMSLDGSDIRSEAPQPWISMVLGDIKQTDQLNGIGNSEHQLRVITAVRGSSVNYNDFPIQHVGWGNPIFLSQRPQHKLVPFLAKRKASGFSEAVNSGAHTPVTGTLQNLYSSIDVLATAGHPRHQTYLEATQRILGLTVTTQPSGGGKVAGVYLDDDNFVTLDRMGDGVTEIIALIVELCISRDKVFILEEPETNIHPKGLKALLNLVRESAEHNQFIIATHSNIVIRELGGEEGSAVFGVYRDGDTPDCSSRIEAVERSPAAHMELLRELGYEFTDFSLFEGWFFLEESSAEQIVRDILIPFFVPKLKGRLRTFSAGGVDNLEPTVAEFRRLMTFVHLQPAYEGRLWIRTDGDEAGLNALEKMRDVFPNLDEQALTSFQQPQFELYYPPQFQAAAEAALANADKRAKREAKAALLREVLDWTIDNPEEAKAAWEASATEVIATLKSIAKQLR